MRFPQTREKGSPNLTENADGMESELAKMLSGHLYEPSDPALLALRLEARQRMHAFNASEEGSPQREVMLRELLGSLGTGCYVESLFRFDYGRHIHLGDHVFANFDLTILDCAEVRIGDRCLIGPGVHIYTATHPLDVETRRTNVEQAHPVTIGNDVWVGGRCVINPGITIGNGAVLASGAVVTKDVEPYTLVGGCPARVIKELAQ